MKTNIKEENIKKLLKEGAYDDLKKALSSIDPADVADILEDLPPGELGEVFKFLDSETASDVISEMEKDVDEVVEVLSADKIAKIIHEMAPDDAADFFNELDVDEKKSVMPLLSEADQNRLKELVDYEEDSAGGLMTLEFCSVFADATVQQAINSLIGKEYADPISMIFVVDHSSRLTGTIHIADLLSKKKNSLMDEVVEANPVYAKLDEDQEQIANNFRKYDLCEMAVIDENHKILGRITVDDVMDVFHEEASEDMAHISGAPDIKENEDSQWGVVKLRLPWLMITMFTGMIISVIIQKLTGLNNAESLAAFIPVIMAMGGNTGMQASAVTIRSIALGEIECEKLHSVFMREIMVGMMMGIICGIFTGVIVWFNATYFLSTLAQPILQLSIIVGVSMCIAMTFAAFTGTFLPIVLHRFEIDPAVASGPFVTTGNDLAASLIYFLMCYLLLSL